METLIVVLYFVLTIGGGFVFGLFGGSRGWPLLKTVGVWVGLVWLPLTLVYSFAMWVIG